MLRVSGPLLQVFKVPHTSKDISCNKAGRYKSGLCYHQVTVYLLCQFSIFYLSPLNPHEKYKLSLVLTSTVENRLFA